MSSMVGSVFVDESHIAIHIVRLYLRVVVLGPKIWADPDGSISDGIEQGLTHVSIVSNMWVVCLFFQKR